MMENTIKSDLSADQYSWDLRGWETFWGASIVLILVNFIQKELLIDESIYQGLIHSDNELIKNMDFLSLTSKWGWIVYFFIPIGLFFKLVSISCSIFIGAFIFEWNVKFKAIMGVVFKANLVFLIGHVVQTIVMFFSEIDSLEDLYSADLFSFSSLIGRENIAAFLIPFVDVFNVLNALFVFLMALDIKKVSGNKLGLSFILLTYGVFEVLVASIRAFIVILFELT